MNLESIQAKFNWGKLLLFLIMVFLLANILVLDVNVFKKEEGTVAPVVEEAQPEATPLSSLLVEADTCPAVCLEAIAEATGESAQVAPTPATAVSSGVKEIYIPLGSGSTQSITYVELSGIESVIDMGNYPKVKEIIFEATMRIPTANGRVYAKLFNVTDKHDAWYSEVYAEGSSGYRAESGNVVLAPGRKLYRVMMKSTMGYEAILDSARIKILLE